MLLLWGLRTALAAAGAETPEAEAQRGWYLWRTGQDEAATALAAELVAREPRSLPVLRLHAAMAVAAGEGASLEARTREWWGEDPADPVRRVGLAWAITWRHGEEGAWCDEVRALVEKVVEGEPHYWATLADRERERRCTGDTDHADAELIRLQVAGGIGAADGVLAKVDAGYIKPELPDALAEVLAAEPWRVDRAAALWRDGVSGPARAAARKVARQALSSAEASDDPVVVHAALRAHRALGDAKAGQAVSARLKALDPGADPGRVRSEAELRDPEIYAKIDACVRVAPVEARACLDGLAIPEAGSVAAYAAYQRSLVAQAASQPEEVFAQARAAHVADPSIRFHARVFARAVAARADAGAAVPPEELELAVAAASSALAGRVPQGGAIDPASLSERVRAQVASDLMIRGRLLRAAKEAEGALRDFGWARSLDDPARPSPVRQLLVGLALADLGRLDEAGLELAYGLAAEEKDTEAIRVARDALRPIAQGWVPGGVSGMIEAAQRAPGDEVPGPHPLVGQVLKDPALLPTPPEAPAADAPPTAARVIVAWAGWAPGSAEALGRVANLAKLYGPKGVEVVALDVASAESAWPEGVALEHRHIGAGAMRALRSVALPTVIVVDAQSRVVAGLSPYDPGTLDLETALDGLLPED